MSDNPTLTADDFTFLGDGDHAYPFTESEDADITGYGHQDRDAFAREVNRWDMECDAGIPPEDQWTAEAIDHKWVTVAEDGERLHVVTEGTPGAIPVTTLWGQR